MGTLFAENNPPALHQVCQEGSVGRGAVGPMQPALRGLTVPTLPPHRARMVLTKMQVATRVPAVPLAEQGLCPGHDVFGMSTPGIVFLGSRNRTTELI